MPQYPNRRSFMSGLLLLSLSPLATGKLPDSKIPDPNRKVLKKIKPLDSNYVAVNGWVVAKDSLTQGIR